MAEPVRRVSRPGLSLLFFYLFEVDIFALRAVYLFLALLGAGVPGGATALRSVAALSAEIASCRIFPFPEKETRNEANDHLDEGQQGNKEDDKKYYQ